MKQRLAFITAGYFAVIAIILAAVLPFAVDVLHRVTVLQHDLGPAQVNAQDLEAAAVDQETGERGYVITGDPTYLAPWTSGRHDAARAFTALSRLSLTRDEHESLAAAKTALTQWQRNAEGEISATGRGELAHARALVGSGTGRYYFNRFRTA